MRPKNNINIFMAENHWEALSWLLRKANRKKYHFISITEETEGDAEVIAYSTIKFTKKEAVNKYNKLFK